VYLIYTTQPMTSFSPAIAISKPSRMSDRVCMPWRGKHPVSGKEGSVA